MDSRRQQSNLLKFFRKMKGSRVPGWGLQAMLLLTLLACSGLTGGGGGGGGGDNPFAGGALDQPGGGGGGQFTGDAPGGQVTEDGVVREAPKMVRVRVQDGSGDTSKSLMRWDENMADPPTFELPPDVTGPFVMVQSFHGRVEVVPLNIDQKNISLESETDGEIDIPLHFPLPKDGPCQNQFRIWACKISEGQYYESQVLELSCPVGFYDNPYGTNSGDQNTTLTLHQAPSKPCPNPVPQLPNTNQAF